MRNTLIVIFFFSAIHVPGQNPSPGSLGLRHILTMYKGDTVNILVKSKKGEENISKPIFLFIQGSLPIPLIMVYNQAHTYSVFPFNLDSLSEKYHIAIIGKPCIPLMVDTKDLAPDMIYTDPSTKEVLAKYIDRNYLDYYVQRDLFVIGYLQTQKWVSGTKLVVAGHSEGSTIAAKLASLSKKVTHLVYLSGNPFGRIMSVIEESRKSETDTTKLADKIFTTWKNIVNDPTGEIVKGMSDTYKSTFEFSYPPINYLEKLAIPIFVAYGTRDYCSPYNDFLQVEAIREKKYNFTFRPYIGLEHNFFPVDKSGLVNYDMYGWDKVGADIYKWLRAN